VPRILLRRLDKFVRSNLYLYLLVRKAAVFLCRFLLLEDGFSFLRYVRPTNQSLALDVGSNDGTSIEMIIQTIPGTEVISFDPVRSPNKERHQVTFKNVALSDVPGELIIYSPWIRSHHLSQYSSFDKDKVVSQLCEEFDLDNSEIQLQEVKSSSITLDSLDLSPFLLKIDVEGHELQVLLGSRETLKRTSPIVLVEIQNEYLYREISLFLENEGYFHLSWPQQSREPNFAKEGTYSSGQNNYLFIHAKKSSTWSFRQ
jgi:FkbM family methyltransferase